MIKVCLNDLVETVNSYSNPEKAKNLQRFFKTGKGQCGEGDIFLGLVVPIQRRIAKQFSQFTLNDVTQLLSSKIHEHRLIALFILIEQYKRGEKEQKKAIFNLYISHTQYINNWDLIDLSAPQIVGEYLFEKDYTTLYTFAKSVSLWKKRIAILATFADIKRGRFDRSLAIAEILLHDKHDLIHKATRWMTMPRTMLRYAIERFSEEKRLKYTLRK